MAVQMAGGLGEQINYTSISPVLGLSAFSILLTVNQTESASNSYRVIEIVNPAGLNTNERYLIQLNATNDARNFGYFRASTVNTGGEWRSSSDTIPLNTNTFIGVTHDLSSINNDPIFYVNGASVTANEINAPSGEWRNTGATNLYLGGRDGTVKAYAGSLFNILIYNRVLSAAEIADAYNSRRAIPNFRGLVFAPELRGASGGVDDGDALGATNYVIDRVNGVQGTPNNSPVLRADTVLNF